MNSLIINLTGRVNASNFDELKREIISLIKSVETTLITDEDFYRATKQVNSFKAAEKAFKEGKKAALDQVEDIQKLFSAIDEISAEARQTRLLLERQIKTRKLEIKEQCIQAGIDCIESYIEMQTEEFKYIDTSHFTGRSRFDAAVYGKASKTGVQNAIDALIQTIKLEVSDKALELTRNKARIDALSDEYKLLFQDWKTLIDISETQLECEIDERIRRFSTLLERKNSSDGVNDLVNIIINDDLACKKNKYRIILDIYTSIDAARELARTIRDNYGDDPSVCLIRLTPCPEGE